MRTFLIVLSSILTLGCALPYVVEIIRGKTKPRIVSWFTWSLLSGIACVASFTDKEYATGILMIFATIETLLIVALGFKHGDRHIERFDIICQIAALVGIVLWLIFNSPAIAVIAAVTIDLIGALPTFKHAWQKPYEETAITFVMAAMGAFCTLLVVRDWKITAILYPAYILLVNASQGTIILLRAKYAKPGVPAKLRDFSLLS